MPLPLLPSYSQGFVSCLVCLQSNPNYWERWECQYVLNKKNMPSREAERSRPGVSWMWVISSVLILGKYKLKQHKQTNYTWAKEEVTTLPEPIIHKRLSWAMLLCDANMSVNTHTHARAPMHTHRVKLNVTSHGLKQPEMLQVVKYHLDRLYVWVWNKLSVSMFACFFVSTLLLGRESK